MARKYYIETFGCQMNVHDSERLAGLLDQAGYEPVAAPTEADLVVINTCSVRERAEVRLYTELGMVPANTAGKRPIVAVTGCVAQQEGSALLERGSRVDLVVGTQALTRLPEMVERLASERPERVDINPYDNVSFPLGVARRSDPVKASVTIIEGCNDFCAFCVVPYTRGHERMRPAGEIIEEVRLAANEGHREIHLLGQIVNHYAAPDRPGCDFAGLLELVHEVEGVERIRFASPHPRHVTDRMIAAMRALPKVCRHLHLPVQSGSTSVLARMRRRHTRDDYLKLVDRLRTAMPDIALSTEMIVGFPGETGGGVCRHAQLDQRHRLPQHVLVQVLGTAQHACGEAVGRRRLGSREDLSDRRAARPAEGHSGPHTPSARGPRGRGAGRLDEPQARLGASRPDDKQHRGQLHRTPGTAWAHGACAHHSERLVQPAR